MRTNEDGSIVLADGTVLNSEKYLFHLLQQMIDNKASDIYFTYGEEPVLRVYGEAHRIANVPKFEDSTLESIANILMTDEDIDNYKANLSCDLGYSVHGRRYRINISRQR